MPEIKPCNKHRYECETINEQRLASHYVGSKEGHITGKEDKIKKVIFCIYCGDSRQIYPEKKQEKDV